MPATGTYHPPISEAVRREPDLMIPGLVLAGVIGMTVQVSVLRELFATCRGGEFTIGAFFLAWLLWTALGSGLFAAIVPHRVDPGRLFHALIPVYGFFGYLSAFLFMDAPFIFRLLPGEAIPYDLQFMAAVLFTAPFNVLGGVLFSLGVRATESPKAPSSGLAFTAEAFGAALGGLLFSGIIVHVLPNRFIALTCPVAGSAWLCVLSVIHRSRACAAVVPPVLALTVVLYAFGVRASGHSYLGQTLIEERDTPFGRLRLTRTGEQVTFTSDTSILFSAPDPERTEYMVHIPILAARDRSRVLILGGGPGGAASEAMKYSDVRSLTLVELDPVVFTLARVHLGERYSADPRIRIVSSDPRAFLARTRDRFDVIIMTAPAPLSGLANRSYTREFFRLASSRMTSGGVIGFALEGSENYIDGDLARFLASIRAELRAAFPSVAVLPGLDCRFIASNRAGALDGLSWERLDTGRARLGIETSYVRDWFLRYTMSPERVSAVTTALDAVIAPLPNTDMRPAGYLARTIIQGKLDSSRIIRAVAALTGTNVLAIVLIVIAAVSLIPLIPFGRHASARAASSLVFIAGFAGISFTMIGIMAYQSIFGYLYGHLAFLTGAFMAGLALGGWLGVRRAVNPEGSIRRLPLVQAGIAFAALLWMLLFRMGGHPLAEPAFFMVAAFSGFAGGLLFPIADRVYRSAHMGTTSAGSLYAFDLAGSSLGALLTGTLLVPGIGMVPTLLFIAGLCILTAVAAWAQGR